MLSGLQNIGITLTKRGAGSATERHWLVFTSFYKHYLPKLVKAGLRVAICDQLEDPKMTKTHCKRGVTELTQVSMNDEVLHSRQITSFPYFLIINR
jgi:DNA mismatch repair protein MutS